jgi:hypothetical protein
VDAEFGGEARGRLRYATVLERVGHGRGEAGALECVALLQLRVAGDDRVEPEPEFASAVTWTSRP